MKRNTMLWTMILLAVGLMGCGGEEEGDELLLFHPANYETIGYVVAGDYHMSDLVIQGRDIERTVVSLEAEMALSPPSPVAQPNLKGEVCWKVQPAGLRCEGCCKSLKCTELCVKAEQ